MKWGVRMKIFNKKEKEKEEIKTLINMLEYCHALLIFLRKYS